MLSEELKTLRLRKGISHDKLSKALKEKYGVQISSESLKRYEKSEHACSNMSAERLCALAKFYDISIDYLLGISEYMDPKTAKLTVAGLGLSENATMSMIGQNSIVPHLNLLANHDILGLLLDALSKYYYACEADSVVEAVKEQYALENNGARPSNDQIAGEISNIKFWNVLSTQTTCDLLTLSDRYKRAEETAVYTDNEADQVFLNKLQMRDIYELKSFKYYRAILEELKNGAERKIRYRFLFGDELGMN